MSKCYEILIYKARKDELKEFTAVNKIRQQVISRKLTEEGILFDFLFQVPFLKNEFVRVTAWTEKEKAMRYCCERFQRDKYMQFLKDYVEDLAIFFLGEIDISTTNDVPSDLLKRLENFIKWEVA